MENLNNYLDKNHSFRTDEVDIILSYFRRKEIEKGESFLGINQYCQSVAFVEAGCFYYYFLKDGEEKVCDFAFESDWMTQYKSLLNNEPSEIGIKALEHSVLYYLSMDNMQKLLIELPKANVIRSSLAEQYFTATSEHATSLANLKAEERYKLLLEKKPFIHQKVPQYHIASYLGIKPQSLSRIRAKKS